MAAENNPTILPVLAADPAGETYDGAFYASSTTGKVRCLLAGVWTDLS